MFGYALNRKTKN